MEHCQATFFRRPALPTDIQVQPALLGSIAWGRCNQGGEAEPKACKLSDSGDLCLLISTTGYRSWRLMYRFGGKGDQLVLGPYPAGGLPSEKAAPPPSHGSPLARTQASAGAAEAYAWPALDVDLRGVRPAVARQGRWDSVHAVDAWRGLERDVFPAIGGSEIPDIDATCAANQILYNVKRRVRSSICWMAERSMPMMAYSPVEQGRLVRNDDLGRIAADVGATPARVALACTLRRDGVIAIPKANTVAQVRGNRAALDVVLHDATFPASAPFRATASMHTARDVVRGGVAHRPVGSSGPSPVDDNAPRPCCRAIDGVGPTYGHEPLADATAISC